MSCEPRTTEKRPNDPRQENDWAAPLRDQKGIPASFKDTPSLKALYTPVEGERLSNRADYVYLGYSERGEEHESSVALSTISGDVTVPGVRVFINHFDDEGNVGPGFVARFASISCLRRYAQWLGAQADRLQVQAEAYEWSEVDRGL